MCIHPSSSRLHSEYSRVIPDEPYDWFMCLFWTTSLGQLTLEEAMNPIRWLAIRTKSPWYKQNHGISYEESSLGGNPPCHRSCCFPHVSNSVGIFPTHSRLSAEMVVVYLSTNGKRVKRLAAPPWLRAGSLKNHKVILTFRLSIKAVQTKLE